MLDQAKSLFVQLTLIKIQAYSEMEVTNNNNGQVCLLSKTSQLYQLFRTRTFEFFNKYISF